MAKKVQFTTNQPSASTDYLAADNTWKTMSGGGGGGTVTSVALTTPAAFNVSGSPITTSGTIAISGAGTASQYVKGDGTLGTTATSLPPSGTAGGDLTGTYPNPTVHRIHGVDMQSGTPSADEVWVYGGSPAKWQHQKLHASQTTNDSTVSGTNVDDALDTLKTTKQDTITGAATTVTTTDLTGSRVLVSNPGGKIAVSAVTTTEVGYLVGVTSDIQTQLNSKSSVSKSFLVSNFGAGSVAGLGTVYGGFVRLALQNAANEYQVRTIMPSACTFRNFTANIGAQPATGSLVFTMRIDAADTAYTLTIAAGSGGGIYQNTTTSLAVPNMSQITVKIVNNAITAQSQLVSISVMVEI